MPDDRPIGVFDSGIGGLTLVHALSKALPNERMIFFGDTAHLPYGDKSAKNIQAFAEEILHFFYQQNCKAVLVACNTASAIAYPKLLKSWGYHLLLFNVIDPVVRTCIQAYKPQKVGVIGTKSTIQSRSYPRKFNQLDKTITVTTASTPLLAPMIEEGFYNNKISQTLISAYLSKKQFDGIEALILGCTHYPLIKKEVESFYRGSTPVLDNIDPTIAELANSLGEKDMLNHSLISDTTHPESLNAFYVSDYTQSFEETAKLFFGETVILQKYDLWGYGQ
jgi:glutamate racemase